METPVIFDRFCGIVSFGDKSARLTQRQRDLLLTVARGAGRVVPYDVVVKASYGDQEPDDAADSLKVHAVYIRRKIAAVGAPPCFHTHWGVGYYTTNIVIAPTDPTIMLSGDKVRLVRRLIETHPNEELAERVRQAVFG